MDCGALILFTNAGLPRPRNTFTARQFVVPGECPALVMAGIDGDAC
jgi:hypothetical protein